MHSSMRLGESGGQPSVAEITSHDPHASSLSPRGRVLVVDDEPNARSALSELLALDGYETASAADGRRALAMIESFDPDVVITDLKMPGLDGIGLLREAKPKAPHSAFLVMTAFGSIETAVAAIREGAENYLTKPLDLDSVATFVARAMEKAKLSREAADLRARVESRLHFDSILGDHPSMQRLLKMVRQVAPSRATVLILGESGTGKELIAAAIHQNSPRKAAPFVRLNCAALAETLLESELFGHERGSFTGAAGRREGRFMQANGGTLFLDEVSEIPPSVQVKLLRFLQEREFERVGGNETVTVDVRIVAASNRSLKEAVRAGTFREDLYYRLNVVELDVPPLRERRTDVPILAHHFLRKVARESAPNVRGFSDSALRYLMTYPWPGNVRELENAIERAVIMCEGDEVGVTDFPPSDPTETERLKTTVPLGMTLEEIERIAIRQALDASGGSTARAAEMLGISQRKIQYRLKEWGRDG
jgi:DNA-binding NtrC family response regulator